MLESLGFDVRWAWTGDDGKLEYAGVGIGGAVIQWTPGDGGEGTGRVVDYTYTQPGKYLAQVRAVDGQGTSASASQTVEVTNESANVPTAGSWGGLSPRAIDAVVVGVGIVGTAPFAVLRLRAHGGLERAPPDRGEGIAGVGGRTTPSTEGAPPGLPVSGAAAKVDRTPSREVDRSSSTTVAGASPLDIARGETPHDPGLQLSQRVLLHLLWSGSRRDDSAPSAESTQQGMAHALGVGQDSVRKVLARLVAAGVVESSSRHVAGISRRVKAHGLPPRGTSVARALWASRGRVGSNVGEGSEERDPPSRAGGRPMGLDQAGALARFVGPPIRPGGTKTRG
ncbi:MAG: PKD domain-containing protein [Thermoplasmata archaeon]